MAIRRRPASAGIGLGRLVERANREVVDDGHPVPTPAAARPGVAIQRIHIDPDLACEMRDHCRSDVSLVVRKAPVLTPKRELDRKAELAGVNPAGSSAKSSGSRDQRSPNSSADHTRCITPASASPQASDLTNQKRNTSP